MQKRALILGLMLAVLAAGAAWTQQPTTAAPVTGRIVSIDSMGKTFTVQTSTGNVVFKTDGQTMFMREDTRMNLADLKVGDQIRVTYTGSDPDRIAAHVDSVADSVDTGNTYKPTGTTASGTTGTTTGTTSGATISKSAGMGTGTGTSMGMGTTVTGRVTSVDVAGRQVTIETPSGSQTYMLGTDARIMARNGSTDFSSISTGDQVRLQVSSDSRTASRIDYISSGTGGTTTRSSDTMNESGTVSANRQLPHTASWFPLIGAAGIAMIALALALRERRLRLV